MKHFVNIFLVVLCLCVSCTVPRTDRNTTFKNKSVYRWRDGMCKYKSFFDSAIFSRKQIENAMDLINAAGTSLFRTKFYHDDIIKSDIDDLKNQYDSLYNHFRKMSLPDIVPLDSCRKALLNDLAMTYEGRLAVYMAVIYDDYQPILALSKTDTTVSYYANALAANNDTILLTAWEYLTTKQAEKNVNPEKVWARFNSEKENSDWKKYAKEDLLKFGWWNSYNRTIPHFKLSEKKYDLYDKLFIETKTIDCDEF